MDVIVERPAALDVHKAQVTACVRMPGRDGSRAPSEVVEFSTMVGGLLVLRDWLKAHGVTKVAMEATSVYWKPVWAVLEDEFELLLVNARHVKTCRAARPTSRMPSGCASCWRPGLLRASFVPPKPIRALRQLTRYRKAQIKERQREANRLAQGAGGHRDQARLRRYRHPRRIGRACSTRSATAPPTPRCSPTSPAAGCAKKIPLLKQALEGRFEPLHALLVSSILAHLDFLDEQVERLSEAIEEQLRPFAPAV